MQVTFSCFTFFPKAEASAVPGPVTFRARLKRAESGGSMRRGLENMLNGNLYQCVRKRGISLVTVLVTSRPAPRGVAGVRNNGAEVSVTRTRNETEVQGSPDTLRLYEPTGPPTAKQV